MKRVFTVLVMVMGVTFIKAQVITEYFEKTIPGDNLEGVNGWYVSLKPGDAYGVSPVIGNEALTYSGYPASAKGHVVVLSSEVGETTATQRISTKLVAFGEDPLKNVEGEKIYVAFMIKIEEDSKTNAWRDFFTLEGSEASSMVRGRVFARIATNKDLFLTVTKNSNPSNSIEGLPVLDIAQTHLVVMVYEGVEGDLNDVVTLYVNPDPTKDEHLQENKIVAFDSESQSDYSLAANLGINIRQRGLGAQIGGIRVAKTWENIFTNVDVSVGKPFVISNFVYDNNQTVIVTQMGG